MVESVVRINTHALLALLPGFGGCIILSGGFGQDRVPQCIVGGGRTSRTDLFRSCRGRREASAARAAKAAGERVRRGSRARGGGYRSREAGEQRGTLSPSHTAPTEQRRALPEGAGA
ncbi:hypothetical protein NDU88_007415, partial [Pleurodeles waltl]